MRLVRPMRSVTRVAVFRAVREAWLHCYAFGDGSMHYVIVYPTGIIQTGLGPTHQEIVADQDPEPHPVMIWSKVRSGGPAGSWEIEAETKAIDADPDEFLRQECSGLAEHLAEAWIEIVD